MKTKTRQDLTNFVRQFLKSLPLLDKAGVEAIKLGYPFHAAIFSEESLVFARNERSIVTRMGQKFYPTLAEIIAKDRFSDVHQNHKIEGSVDTGYLEAIDKVIHELRANKRKPSHEKEIKEIFSKKNNKIRDVRVIADLYVGDFTGGPLFLEIKSPMPNLDVCDESKRKILTFLAITKGKKSVGFLAFPYNPYITRENYKHSFTKKIMDMEKQILMGKEFWDMLGGKGTYKELLGIIKSVKEEEVKS